jgi:hypothetical protein
MSFGSSSQESKSSSQLPEWYVPYAKESLKRGQQIANQGYTPYMGADVAAFNPQQISGMQGAADWNAAFNTPGQAAPSVAASLPQAQNFGNGMQGYSSYGGYMDQLENLKKKYPGMFRMIQAQAINPVTGQQGGFPPSAPKDPYGGGGSGGGSDGGRRDSSPASPVAAMATPPGVQAYNPASREAQLFGTGGGGGMSAPPSGGGSFMSDLFQSMLGMSGGSASREGVGNFWDPSNWTPGTRQAQGGNPFTVGGNNMWGMGGMGFDRRGAG